MLAELSLADERVISGINTSEDAGVFVLDESRALVQTLDFITPIVDDPFIFGAIAAANSLKFAYMIFIGADLALGRTCAIMLACSQPASFKALSAAFASLLGKAKSNPPEVCAS